MKTNFYTMIILILISFNINFVSAQQLGDNVTNVAICQGESYNWFGVDYSTAGTYYHDNDIMLIGEDALLSKEDVEILNLVVVAPFYRNEAILICEGDTVNWRGHEYSKSGDYEIRYVSSLGCDSIYFLHVDVNPLPTLDLGDDVYITDLSQEIVLDAGEHARYSWSTGGIKRYEKIALIDKGVCSLDVVATVTDKLCVAKDTVKIVCNNSVCNDVTLSVGDSKEIFGIDVYPNPSNGRFNISSTEDCNYTVMSVCGQVIEKKSMSAGNKIIDLSAMPNGFYMVNFNNGSTEKTLKLIKY